MSRTACPKLASLKAEYLGCGSDMLRIFLEHELFGQDSGSERM